MRVERSYWSFARTPGMKPPAVAFHREVRLRRDDGLIIILKPWVGGSVRVFAAGVVNRACLDFPNMKTGLRYAVKLANAEAAIWRKGQQSRDATARFLEAYKP